MSRNWPWVRDLDSRDRDVTPETETCEILAETKRWHVSRPSRDRDVETETDTTTLSFTANCNLQQTEIADSKR